MGTLHFESVELATARNALEAVSRGCNPDNTRYWWEMIINEDGTADLLVGDDTATEDAATGGECHV